MFVSIFVLLFQSVLVVGMMVLLKHSFTVLRPDPFLSPSSPPTAHNISRVSSFSLVGLVGFVGLVKRVVMAEIREQRLESRD
jgi:hypothetical protein